MRLLIVVDMQKDFVDGALGTAEAQAIVPAVCEKIQKFDGAIIVTQDTHQANYLDTQEGSILPVTHCVQNTPGWELDAKVYAAVKSRGDAAIRSVMKPTFATRFSTWFRQRSLKKARAAALTVSAARS